MFIYRAEPAGKIPAVVRCWDVLCEVLRCASLCPILLINLLSRQQGGGEGWVAAEVCPTETQLLGTCSREQ